ncbi:FAD-dependent oxidoreductase [uncultured Clostridium sp.]|uniref:FAD-dependent oxidoreductase n=1 Tax=uncultured Clostridium sp. TaxID=59620 RepID=UPI0028EE3216|nr:FAD-dependent oxidoreductase [uncultured Clostridium sp.]
MKKLTLTKKMISTFMCLTLAISTVGCKSKPTGTEALSFKAGTYTASKAGHNADIKVEVTVDDTSIKDIKILEHKESPGISDPAIERIPKAIVDGQTLAVDAISGATITSKAILAAVTEAIKSADGDIDALNVKKAENSKAKGETKEYATDVVVIGGGGAGLAAAVSAHQNGAKAIVLEKMSRLGGNTILSGGAYNAVDPKRQKVQGIEDSVDKHYTQTFEGGDKLGKPELIKVLVENAYPSIEWLEKLGMKFDDKVFTVLGGMWPRAHKPSTALGTGFSETYLKYINEHEGARRDVMTKGLMEQKDAYMWVIVDKHSYPTGDTKNNFNESIDELVEKGRAYKADTLEDLAKQIGVDPANFVKAVDEFNKAVEKGGKDKFGRTLFADKIDTAPFYAGARVPTVHHTMGGIEINESAQVLDAKGNIIPGLYAAGEVTGGIHGSNRLGGNALADITVFGKIAGESAAMKK